MCNIPNSNSQCRNSIQQQIEAVKLLFYWRLMLLTNYADCYRILPDSALKEAVILAGNGNNRMIKGAEAASIGFLMVICTVIGYLFGSWLDRKFSTDPWLMIVFTIIGVAAGFYETYRTIVRISRNS